MILKLASERQALMTDEELKKMNEELDRSHERRMALLEETEGWGDEMVRQAEEGTRVIMEIVCQQARELQRR